MNVLMLPNINHFEREESGIRRVVEHYTKYAPDYDIKFVDTTVEDEDKYDLVAIHAGSSNKFPKNKPVVSIIHGLYWTADYNSAAWEYSGNASVLGAIRRAKEVTVPSSWVAETFQRDMRFSPHILPHGIEWDEWQHKEESRGYVLWNKNRSADVCDPIPIKTLAAAFPKVRFISTFTPSEVSANVQAIGLQKHSRMKLIIQRSGVYLSTTKETFGIGVLEAMASGVPVLGWASGGNLDLVQHGVTGYLAIPGNYGDLINGLDYCLEHRRVLGENARASAKKWLWSKSVEKLSGVFQMALVEEKPTVSVVIPTYNYGTEEQVGRAIRSVLSQDYPGELLEIVVVDDGSKDGGRTDEVVGKYVGDHGGIKLSYIRQDNQGVAAARNSGVRSSSGKYICCLDADDAIAPTFIKTCVEALEKEVALGIAYTGLWYRTPDGREGLSEWPGEFDFQRQLERGNQIPTCCVFRRKIWERLGGYRQRYAPGGAGAEDAEFWLRAGAYGWNAKKVTPEGLFLYSWMSGRVSGNKAYKETDWTAWHPWTKDGQHPFASVAKPKRQSHPVRQYDEPIISAIIPVGEGHEKEIINALDSLEAQTYRKWEVILSWDSPENPSKEILDAYPYARIILGNESKGAGFARNEGARFARGSFLLFLDADDWLYPSALDKMMAAWEVQPSIIYSDYIGKGVVDDTTKLAPDLQKNLLDWDEKTHVAVIKHSASDYDCERASQQPIMQGEKVQDVYLWANVTCLIPIEWHTAIGGFDESMPSWEDVDYHWRMARAGRCYTRIPEELLVYRFYSGNRRQLGLKNFQNLIQYLQDKYKEIAVMPCSGCGNSRVKPAPRIFPGVQSAPEGMVANTMSDENFVLTEYMHPNRGQHSVIGATSRISYGYRGGGEVFLVHRDDIAAQPHLFRAITRPVQEVAKAPTPAPVSVQEEKPPSFDVPDDEEDGLAAIEKMRPTPKPTPKPAQTKFDLQAIPGVTPAIAGAFQKAGLDTPESIAKAGIEKLKEIRGVGPNRAFVILDWAEKYLDESKK